MLTVGFILVIFGNNVNHFFNNRMHIHTLKTKKALSFSMILEYNMFLLNVDKLTNTRYKTKG